MWNTFWPLANLKVLNQQKMFQSMEAIPTQWECIYSISIHHIDSLGLEIFVCNRFWPCASSKVLNKQKIIQSLEAM